MRKKHNIIFVQVLGALLSVGVTACAAAPADGILDKAQLLFLQRQYVQAIDECVKAVKEHPDNPAIISQANYLTGASYVNLFDFLTAKKNFQVIVDQYSGSPYYEDAYMGLGDIEFLQENYGEALKVYEQFLRTDPSPRRRATLYFRLAEIYLKRGDRELFKKYYDKLQKEFPLSFEAKDARRLQGSGSYYTVQVGAFTNFDNAQECINQLKAKGYNVYSVLCMLSGKKLCRIRVGRYATEKEAEEAKGKLESDGFLAKVFPLE